MSANLTSDDAAAHREVAFRVTGGGAVTAEELAAVTVALTPIAATTPAATSTVLSGWARAALVEGVGGRPPVSHPDLVQGRFGLGHVGDPHAS